MEMLDENEIGKLIDLGCTRIFDCTQQLKCVVLDPCRVPFWCDWKLKCPAVWKCTAIFWCNGPLFDHLTEGLKACGDEFYIKCPGFDRIERYCEFEPAIDAVKWKEQVQLDKVAKLEARIQELELVIKKKG
jgi:hypothetical protein